MKPEQVLSLVKREMSNYDSANRFRLNPTNRHVHNDIDAPFVYLPYALYGGFVPYDGGYTGTLELIMPKNWKIVHPLAEVSFTASLSMGATSGTLTAPWSDTDALGYVLTIYFDNGDTSIGTFTAGSASVTWADALSSAAGADIIVEAIGQYTLVHNLGTLLYSFVADATQSTNVVVSPVISTFTNEVSISWFDNSSARQDTSFNFICLQVDNKSESFPTYTTENTLPRT